MGGMIAQASSKTLVPKIPSHHFQNLFCKMYYFTSAKDKAQNMISSKA